MPRWRHKSTLATGVLDERLATESFRSVERHRVNLHCLCVPCLAGARLSARVQLAAAPHLPNSVAFQH